jgi:hypothetical protein
MLVGGMAPPVAVPRAEVPAAAIGALAAAGVAVAATRGGIVGITIGTDIAGTALPVVGAPPAVLPVGSTEAGDQAAGPAGAPVGATAADRAAVPIITLPPKWRR